jgi:antitoxin component of RelBE/YafQ-DinJ toxin-antitoxin module
MNTTLHVTVDKKTKDAAGKLAAEMGLDLSTIVKASLKTFVQTGVFHVERSFRMTPYLEGIIAQARADYKAGRNTSPVFTSAKEMDEYLDSL